MPRRVPLGTRTAVLGLGPRLSPATLKRKRVGVPDRLLCCRQAAERAQGLLDRRAGPRFRARGRPAGAAVLSSCRRGPRSASCQATACCAAFELAGSGNHGAISWSSITSAWLSSSAAKTKARIRSSPDSRSASRRTRPADSRLARIRFWTSIGSPFGIATDPDLRGCWRRAICQQVKKPTGIQRTRL
jgi:hypothetical protein